MQEVVPYHGLVQFVMAGLHYVESPSGDDPPEIETSSDVNNKDEEDEFDMAEVSII